MFYYMLLFYLKSYLIPFMSQRILQTLVLNKFSSHLGITRQFVIQFQFNDYFMDNILVRISGAAPDLRVSYPEEEVVQLNFSRVIDLNFTSFNNEGLVIAQFTFNNCFAVKLCSNEAIIQMDTISRQFTVQCIITPTDQSVLVSTQNTRVITVHPLDQMLATYRPFLETIPEEQEEISIFDQSPQRRKFKQQLSFEAIHHNKRMGKVQEPQSRKKAPSHQQFDKENIKSKSNKKHPSPPQKKSSYLQYQDSTLSPQKKQSPSKKQSPASKSPPQKPKRSVDQTNRTKRTTNKGFNFSPSKKEPQQSPSRVKDQKQDYVDNHRKNKSKKRRPSTAVPLRPKIDSEGMIDRQWLEEEMINEEM